MSLYARIGIGVAREGQSSSSEAHRDPLEGAKCREKIFWPCAIDLLLEGGSSA
jgi:hypothetical protein